MIIVLVIFIGISCGSEDVKELDEPSKGVSDSGEAGNRDSFGFSMSADGRFVVFTSNEEDLPGDRNKCFRSRDNCDDVFLYDALNKEVTLVSTNADGEAGDSYSKGFLLNPPLITADGSTITFTSDATNLVPDKKGIFMKRLSTGEVKLVKEIPLGSEDVVLSDHMKNSSISSDGRYLIYGGNSGIFIFDWRTEKTERVDTDDYGLAEYDAEKTSLSQDGRYVTFTLKFDLVDRPRTFEETRRNSYIKDMMTG
ncbi:MAG: TolB family protein, partial [Thermoleophilia bacterium]